MTSEERREKRYQRRVARRAAHKQELYAKYNDFEWVFSYRHLYDSYKKCRRNVGWKASVQRYITNAPLNVWNTYEQLMTGKYKTKGFFEFDVFERGKKRHIKSVTIGERVVQRCLCDYALVPMVGRTFVYDNGASMENKGYTFAINRICQHLREHYRKHGNEGYIWDYSQMPFNLLGQICPQFTVAWAGLSLAAIVLDDYIRYWLFGEEKPKYKLF